MDKPIETPIEATVADSASAIALLEKFATSAEGIELFAHNLITEVEEGRVDPLRVALFMKTMEKIKERVNERLEPYYLNEAQKHGKSFEYRGAKITVEAVSTKYDYSSCGHPGYDDLTKIIEQATEQRKNIETLLKALTGPQTLVIEDEVVTVMPPVKKQKDGIKISIK